jgi:hypothetical protein
LTLRIPVVPAVLVSETEGADLVSDTLLVLTPPWGAGGCGGGGCGGGDFGRFV